MTYMEDVASQKRYLRAKAKEAARLAATREVLLALRGHNLAAMVEAANRLETAIAQAELKERDA
mgnify:CR=1 FL=1